jgi:ribosome-binding ATPase YchF (GTP1/OBG family)
VLNIGEDQLADAEVVAGPVREAFGAGVAGGALVEVLPMCVQLEAEAAQLPAEERQELLDAYDLGEGAVARLIQSAYRILGRRTFFTTGPDESRAWTFRAGAKAPECAGVIHTDFQRGFIKAECVHWDELLELGSWSKARDVGKLRIEGKEYEVVDGDVLEFRFNV